MERQPACQNDRVATAQTVENIGAGEGNRTLVISLEGWMTAKRIKGDSCKTARFGP